MAKEMRDRRVAQYGSTVRIRDDEGAELCVELLPPNSFEQPLLSGNGSVPISSNSPLACALVGHRRGDEIRVISATGKRCLYRVLDVDS